MGYAGYAPGSYAPEYTDHEKLLNAIASMETLQTVKKIVNNVAVAPTEAKYRKVNLSNEKIQQLLVQGGGVAPLMDLGWTEEEEEGKRMLVLPAGKYNTMLQVRAIDGAISRLEEKLKAEARSAMAKKKAALDPEKERLRLQMEADRRERAAQGPVTQGSVAQPLPSHGGKTASLNSGAGGGGHNAGGKVRCIHGESDWRAALAEGKRDNKLVVADFTASWCGPCQTMKPIFEEFSLQYKGTIFLKVDVDEAQDVASECGVSAMPTFQLFRGGAKVAEMRGANPAQLEQLLKANGAN